MERFLKLLRSKRIKNAVYYVGNAVLRLLYLVVSVKMVENNRIAVFNFNGKGFGDNPKYVIQTLLEKKYHGEISDDIDICWLVSKEGGTFPEGIRAVKFYSLKGFISCATSKIWVSNARLPLFLRKKKDQTYIQLWHGGCGPKKIEGAAEDKLIRWYITAAKHDSKMTDYHVSNSGFNTEMIKKYFWYDGKILEYGSPRHDPFFKNTEDLRRKVKESYAIAEDTKILLYAPTFRSDKSVHPYIWDYERLVTAAEEKFGGNWVMMVRLHPNISFLDETIQYSDRVKNATHYDDMQELICAADILVSDYSGVTMQAALAGKLILLLLQDEDEYLNDRGLSIDFHDSPFIQAASVDELCDGLHQVNVYEYKEQLKKYIEDFHFYDDGNASERVAEKILTILMKE